MTKTLQSFKTIGTKLYKELPSQGTQGKCWRMDGWTDERTDGNLHA